MITVTLRYNAFTERSIYDLIKATVPNALISSDYAEPFAFYARRNIEMQTFEEWENLIMALDETEYDYEIEDFKEDEGFESTVEILRERMKATSVDYSSLTESFAKLGETLKSLSSSVRKAASK